MFFTSPPGLFRPWWSRPRKPLTCRGNWNRPMQASFLKFGGDRRSEKSRQLIEHFSNIAAHSVDGVRPELRYKKVGARDDFPAAGEYVRLGALRVDLDRYRRTNFSDRFVELLCLDLDRTPLVLIQTSCRVVPSNSVVAQIFVSQ